MQLAERATRLSQALALGLVQGPSELLPVSSSAHMRLIPLLAGWSHEQLEAEQRKSFEIAVHGGAGLALALALRGEMAQAGRELTGRRTLGWALALIPPALAGLTLRGLVERRLGGPRSIAGGLLTGALAMALADLGPAGDDRKSDDFGALDGLALGLAQALALAPGVSRNGATLTAARMRGYGRAEAQALSWRAGLPVMLGVSALESARLMRGGLRGHAGTLALGAGSAFLSTRALAGPLGGGALRPRRLAPYSVYRCALSTLVVVRLRRAQ